MKKHLAIILALLLIWLARPAVAFVCIAPVSNVETGPPSTIEPLKFGGWLIRSKAGRYFRLSGDLQLLERLKGPDIGDSFGFETDLGDDIRLISNERGLFRLDRKNTTIEAVSGPYVGTIAFYPSRFIPLRKEGWLIASEKGLFRLDREARRIESFPGADVSRVSILNSNEDRVLIYAEQGVFRFDLNTHRLQRLGGADTGTIKSDSFVRINENVLVFGTERGLFRFDTVAERIALVSGAETGEVFNIRQLDWSSNGKALVKAKLGMFLLDNLGQSIEALDGQRALDTEQLQVATLGEGRWLIAAANGLHRLDEKAKRLDAVPGQVTGQVHQIVELKGIGPLIIAEEGLFRMAPHEQHLARVEGPAISFRKWYFVGDSFRELKDGGWLIPTNEGFFRLDAQARRLEAISGLGGGESLHELKGLPSGGWLVSKASLGRYGDEETGLWRLDAQAKKAEALPTSSFGPIRELLDLGKGGWLVVTDRVVARLDSDAEKLAPLNIPPLGEVEKISRVKTGSVRDSSQLTAGWLVRVSGGLFYIDENAERVVRVPAPEIGSGFGYYSYDALPDGRWLVAAENGLFVAIPNFAGASFKADSPTEIGKIRVGQETPIKWTFSHGCGRVAERLGLKIVMRKDGGAGASHEALLSDPYHLSSKRDGVGFSANVNFPSKGLWSFQIVATASGKEVPIASAIPSPIRIDESILDFIQRQWKWFAGALGVMYVGAFAGLFILAHWNQRAFRILLDPVWSRIGVWPFFVLRHWPPAQRWILEPWFQSTQTALSTNRPFLDIPARGPNDARIDSTALLDRLTAHRRLWLQGRAGMGKSEVFFAWQREYYAASSLGQAMHRHGFVLITLPVRQYARLPADPNRPENWVIESVRRRFEEFGADFADVSILGAMLRAGAFAVVLDGMNEADRDGSLVAFARSFPEVRILVTSQGDGPEAFETWRLPHDVSGHAGALLQLWLGEQRGEDLAQRIAREGLMPYLLSGYDMRLIADLAGDDPQTTALPANRIELYRAVLALAKTDDGSPLPLDSLKKLAWTMLIEGRREIRQSDVTALGDRTFDALVKDTVRIVRRVGEVYEFRHDQMRSFLAALWLVEETPNVAAMIQRLEGSPVWQSSRRDQEEVWRFVADLLEPGNDLVMVWRFTLADPNRSFLQAALFSRARTIGLGLAA